MAAMAMAVFWRGLDDAELSAWTGSMLHSGEVLDLSGIDRPKVDKHSTGGVGDKVSIPLAPMVAACGVAVPMVSGRGLSHTGGTLDKLESIEGFTTALDPERFLAVLDECGLVLAGQSEAVVPADRKLYALRDATGTVPSIPLIASSIMSKKLAEDLDGLVLDVKVGSGAFMAEAGGARLLAETMCGIGRGHGVRTVALVTAMDIPLGREIGNASEVRESIEVLRGEGPPDLVELTMALGAEMLLLAGAASSEEEARAHLQQTIRVGTALSHFEQVVAAQGGDPGVVEHPDRLPLAPLRHEVAAPADGYLLRADARRLGVAAMRLGAGRERKEDTIDYGVGLTLEAKPGERVAAGQPLATLVFRHPGRLPDALRVLEGAFEVGESPPPAAPLIIERIG
jgi:pyrimidine-nucleoside phosphorylase